MKYQNRKMAIITATEMLKLANETTLLPGHFVAPGVHYASLAPEAKIEIFRRFYSGDGVSGFEFGQRLHGTKIIYNAGHSIELFYQIEDWSSVGENGEEWEFA